MKFKVYELTCDRNAILLIVRCSPGSSQNSVWQCTRLGLDKRTANSWYSADQSSKHSEMLESVYHNLKYLAAQSSWRIQSVKGRSQSSSPKKTWVEFILWDALEQLMPAALQ